jgi:hypothetical protein
MKYSLYGFIVLLLAFFVISACNKYNNLPGLNGKLVASASAVKIDQPDSLVLVDAKASDSLKWSVVPAGCDTLLTKNNTALIVFTKAGSYKVSVSDNGAAPASRSITVSDSVYNSGTRYNAIPFTGDQIKLIPGYYKSKLGDTSYIYFVAQTKAYYCAVDRINYTDSLTSKNAFSLNFINLQQAAPCTAGSGTISTGINFRQHQLTPLANGTYPLAVTLNGKTYTGNIVVSTANITFNWGYTSGVLITPGEVNR